MIINTIDLDFKDAISISDYPEDAQLVTILYIGSNDKIQYTTYGYWLNGMLNVPGWWAGWDTPHSDVYTVKGEWHD